MIYPQNFSQKIGFDQIKELVTSRCLSEMGRERIQQMTFSTNFEELEMLLEETREFLIILERGLTFPTDDYLDMTGTLRRIQTPGSWMLPEELASFRLSFNTITECLQFFKLPASRSLKHLQSRAAAVEISDRIRPEIDRIMDEKGLIRDQASEALARIRKDIRSKALTSEKLILSLLQIARNSGWTPENAELTISNGRLVIPLLAAYKRKIHGIIHDESATGHTVYLEPEPCLEINNEILELEGAERREIIRILTHFTDFLRPETDNLFIAFDFLGQMDFIRAKALLAKDIGGIKPILKNSPVLHWRTARHPLLFLSHYSKNKSVVPLDIHLDETYRILVISGPNAGGKSVCLKTVGLLQFMLQCGLLVPMDPDSEAGIYKDIFIDIGDEQSLENDLSTYSSHLISLDFFMQNCSPSSLFLIDEMGTGTDPSLGGALAEAVLEKLSGTGAFGVVTTHYSNLKLLAGKCPGIVNGAMLFDTNLLQPLYKLITGKPGSSFTFEIAGRIGLPDDVIENAKGKTGKTHLDFERQLHEVESEKLLLEKQLKEFQVADSFLQELIDKYQNAKAETEKTRAQIIDKAREEAMDLLERSNQLIEKTIREIRESSAEKQITKAAREKVADLKKDLEQTVKAEERGKNMTEKDPNMQKWKKGDSVTIEGRSGTGAILQIKGNTATIDFDGIKISTSIDRLQPGKGKTGHHSSPYSSILDDLNEKAVHFKLTLDVRGKLADEALQMVQKYLDDAYLLRIKEVSILHGKGEGILRKVIREFLAHLEEVKSFEDEHIERGGAGITKVFLH